MQSKQRDGGAVWREFVDSLKDYQTRCEWLNRNLDHSDYAVRSVWPQENNHHHALLAEEWLQVTGHDWPELFRRLRAIGLVTGGEDDRDNTETQPLPSTPTQAALAM